MNDIQKQALKRAMFKSEQELFDYKYPDQVVSDPEFYKRKAELAETAKLLGQEQEEQEHN